MSDAEIRNLGAEPNFPPLPRTRDVKTGRARLRNSMCRHAGGAVAQKRDDPAAFLPEAVQCRMDRMRSAEHVSDNVGTVQPGRHVFKSPRGRKRRPCAGWHRTASRRHNPGACRSCSSPELADAPDPSLSRA